MLHLAAHGVLHQYNLMNVNENATEVVLLLLRCYAEEGRLNERLTAQTPNDGIAQCVATAGTAGVLLEYGSNIEGPCMDGSTPLNIAAGGSDLETVKVYLEAGANTAHVETDGYTLSDWADLNDDNPDVKTYLVDNGYIN